MQARMAMLNNASQDHSYRLILQTLMQLNPTKFWVESSRLIPNCPDLQELTCLGRLEMSGGAIHHLHNIHLGIRLC